MPPEKFRFTSRRTARTFCSGAIGRWGSSLPFLPPMSCFCFLNVVGALPGAGAWVTPRRVRAQVGAILRFGRRMKGKCNSIGPQAPGYPEGQKFPDSVTRIIDDERCEQFMAEGAHFESEYFLTLTCLPPVAREEKVKGWMFEGMKGRQANAARVLEQFKSRIAGFEDVFKSLFTVSRLRSAFEGDGSGQ